MNSTARVVIAASGVTKRFGAQRVLSSLSLECQAGETVLLLGANGAGKSTLLRILAGLARSDSGVVQRADQVKVGYLGHYASLYGALTVGENLELFARLARLGAGDLKRLVESWGLSALADKSVRDLSRGNLSRVAIARALMHSPDVVLLDEPSSNLDQPGVDRLIESIEAGRINGASAIIATHDIARLGRLATRVVVMGRGAIVADSGAADRAEIERVIDLYREINR
jgi:heme exporter protein A